MSNLIYILLIIAAMVVSFKFNPILGAIVTVLLFVIIVITKRSDFYAIKARKAFSEGKFAEAKRNYKKAIDTGRAKMEIRIEYSDTLMRVGDFDGAEQVLNNILRYKLAPEKANIAKLRRCMVYFKKDNLREAYDDAMEIYNDGFKTTYLYALLGYFKICMDKSSDETLAFCKEAYEYNDDRDIMDNLELCYYYRNEYEKAKELSDKILSNDSKFVEAYYHGALVEYALGNYKRAMEYLDKTPSCRWSPMTTVSKEEVAALRSKAEIRLGE